MEARLESADEGRAENAGANEHSVRSEDALRAARDVPAHELVPAFVGRVLRRPLTSCEKQGPSRCQHEHLPLGNSRTVTTSVPKFMQLSTPSFTAKSLSVSSTAPAPTLPRGPLLSGYLSCHWYRAAYACAQA